MEDFPTPAKIPQFVEEQLLFEQSILNTPKPQACSTVNRRQQETFAPLNPNFQFEKNNVQSPAYLSNVIDGMRRLTDQLDTLHGHSEDTKKMPPPTGHQLRKAASIATLSDERRESIMTESEANSSLGILKLDNIQGFSESEEADNVAEILSKFRKEYSFKSLLGKENMQPDTLSSKNTSFLVEKYENDLKSKRGSDVSVTSLRSEPDSVKSRHSLQADLRLRLQKHLAQRTIDRTSDSVRMSQLSDSFDIDGVSFNDAGELSGMNQSKDVQEEFSISSQSKDVGETRSSTSQQSASSPSLTSNATFGAANFLSFSSSPIAIDSLTSESFQPADLAMERLAQDENSWRQQFGDLPAVTSVANEGKTLNQDVSPIQNLTQNLDFSAFSGIIPGDVTVSSSILEDVGKRRLSVGEYFKLHTEQLGGVSGETSDDQRPNFGHLITSPPKRRPHPPLVNISTSQDASLDEVPTRDAGLNMTLSSSFADTIDTSISINSDAILQQINPNFGEDPASRSVELMPPPPPPRSKAVPGNLRDRTSAVRDSISSRLSMSFSIPRDFDESEVKDLNSSSISLDSGEKLASISQIISAMKDISAGPKSKRQLVDDFMRRCKVSSLKTQPHPSDDILHESRSSQHTLKSEPSPKSDTGKNEMNDKPEHSQSRDQRVKDWISTLSNSKSDSTLDNESLEDAEDCESLKGEAKSNGTFGVESSPLNANSLSQLRNDLCDKGKKEKDQKFVEIRKSANRLSNAVFEGDESDTSFMPPPGNLENSTQAKVRLYSTPKGNARRTMSQEVSHGQKVSSSQNPYGFSSKRSIENETKSSVQQHSGRLSTNSQESDKQSMKSQGSQGHSSSSKYSSPNSLKMQKSVRRGTSSLHSESESKTAVSESKHWSKGETRPPSACGSATSCTKSSSRQTDSASVTSGPLQIDSTHSQLSWSSVSPGSSVSQTFALRNKAVARVRLLVSSPNSVFKLIGERGEVLSEFAFTLHAEETRRIHVVFTPLSTGPIVGKLVIRRGATSESAAGTMEDRRLIALYGYGGMAELNVEGASKDRWAQLFLNMCMVDSDIHSEVSDVDTTGDAPEVVALFSVRNSGKVPAFVCLQIAPELPFPNCGVYVNPKEMSLSPGEVGRVVVRFDPSHDILQWLSKNADDMQLLANIWLSWSELATWQRIRRIYSKYYKTVNAGPLSTWGSLYSGELGVGHELKDNKSAEAVLAQAVRRLKVAVLIERERLSIFDLDTTMIFNQLVANETAMFNSPQWNDITLDTSEHQDSPILAGMANHSFKRQPSNSTQAADYNGDHKAFNSNFASPLSSSVGQSKPARNLVKSNLENDLVIVTNAQSKKAQAFSLEFPPTTIMHKSKMKITFQNPSSDKIFVTTSSPSSPFSVSTSAFHLPSNSYITMSILFKPTESGIHHSTLNISVDGNHIRSYFLKGESVADRIR